MEDVLEQLEDNKEAIPSGSDNRFDSDESEFEVADLNDIFTEVCCGQNDDDDIEEDLDEVEIPLTSADDTENESSAEETQYEIPKKKKKTAGKPKKSMEVGAC